MPAALAVAILALATSWAFLPALANGFVNWDDGVNFLENAHYRGLGLEQLRWMWTTFHMGHYQPLSWMTLGLDYLAWGMDPRGYHLTSLLLHAANAALFFFVARALLARALGRDATVGALCAALFFALHPLRVESVAWATERRDVLSGFFYLAAVLLYLRGTGEKSAGRPSAAALACFVASLLSKGIGVTLPLVLLVLDVYPLGRLPADPRQWNAPPVKAVLWEKTWFLVAALPFGVIAFLAQRHTGVFTRFAAVGVGSRLSLAVFGAGFYLWKTLVPLRLLPLYARPADASLWARQVAQSVAAVLTLSVAAVALRRRFPALLAALSCYLITAAPVLGVFLAGIYTAADRYSYLSCLPWAVLVGAAVERGKPRGGPARAGFAAALCALFVSLGVLTRRQTAVWHDSVSLWSYTLSVDPDSAVAHNNLGTGLARAGDEKRAAGEFLRALALDPGYAEAHNNLGTNLVRAGDLEGGAAEYRAAIAAEPGYQKALDNLGAVLEGEGRLGEAADAYRKALALHPEDARAAHFLAEHPAAP